MSDEILITEGEKRALNKLIRTGDIPECDLDNLLSLADKGFLRYEKGSFDNLHQSGPSLTYRFYSTRKGEPLIAKIKEQENG